MYVECLVKSVIYIMTSDMAKCENLCSVILNSVHRFRISVILPGAGGPAWLRHRLDMAGIEGSNPFRPILQMKLKFGPHG